MATREEQLRQAGINASNAASAASAASGQQYQTPQQKAAAGFTNAANAASSATVKPAPQQSPFSAPGSQPWGSQGLPDWTAPTNTEQVFGQAGNYAPTEMSGAWNDVKDQILAPGQGTDVNNEIVNRLMGSNPVFTDRSQDVYSQYMENFPNIANEPGFGDYYKNAEQDAIDTINNTMAARGAYGSSAADNQIRTAVTDLAADRAKNEARYNLDRLAEQRGWLATGGQLATGADTGTRQNILADAEVGRMVSDIAQSGDQNKIDQLKLYLETTFNLDQQQSDFWVRNLTGATAADTQAFGRGDRALEGTTGLGTAISNLLGQDYGAGFESDQELMNSMLEAAYGPDYLKLKGSEGDKQQFMNDIGMLTDLVDWLQGLKGEGG